MCEAWAKGVARCRLRLLTEAAQPPKPSLAWPLLHPDEVRRQVAQAFLDRYPSHPIFGQRGELMVDRAYKRSPRHDGVMCSPGRRPPSHRPECDASNFIFEVVLKAAERTGLVDQPQEALAAADARQATPEGKDEELYMDLQLKDGTAEKLQQALRAAVEQLTGEALDAEAGGRDPW